MVGGHRADEAIFLAGQCDLCIWDYGAGRILNGSREGTGGGLGRKQKRQQPRHSVRPQLEWLEPRHLPSVSPLPIAILATGNTETLDVAQNLGIVHAE